MRGWMTGRQVLRWAGALVNEWTCGQVERWSRYWICRYAWWIGGHVDRCAVGQVERWTDGEVGRWKVGQVDKQTG